MRCLSFLEIMNKNNQIIIISFSDIYRQQHFYEELKENNQGDFIWIEAAGMEGCNCYCDDMAAEMIQEKISPYEKIGQEGYQDGCHAYAEPVTGLCHGCAALSKRYGKPRRKDAAFAGRKGNQRCSYAVAPGDAGTDAGLFGRCGREAN